MCMKRHPAAVAAGLLSSPCGLRRDEKELVRRRLGEGDRACRSQSSNTTGRGACRYKAE
jgi:hypothetical protein